MKTVWTTAGTNRVCGRCLALKDTVVGYTDESGVTIPPLHPRCRCAIMYDEVGTPRVMQPKPKPEPRVFKTPEEATNYFGESETDKKKPYGAWVSQLGKREKEAVVEYTSPYHSFMNGWLRGETFEEPPTKKELQEIKRTILRCESALAKSELPEDILTYRQVGRKMLKLYKNAPNGIFLEEGFTSTTLIKDSFDGGIVDLEIKVHAGKGAGAWVEPLSWGGEEYEFLINRGTKFKVLEIDESGDRPLVKLEVIGRDAKEVKKFLKAKEHSKGQSNAKRVDRFIWKPADIKVQDEQGNWIRGDEFLQRLKQKKAK